MSNIAIRVENLSKLYHIGKRQNGYQTLRDTIMDAFVAPFRRAGKLLKGQATGAAELDETIWALKDVSFEIENGEIIGIIGGNGAGKSTLLKVLSRITEPTKGYAEIHGRVGSLLEVGTGFHPELTGRENIYLNGAILGMSKDEIKRKFDEIVAFAEVEKFIDTPVKHYSSGMYLRLAFAVAAHLEPHILLVDEVLAVGDAAFQKKCLGKMGDVSREGRTVLLVSHNMGVVTRLCERAFWFENGRLKLTGDSNSVVSSYLSQGTQGQAIWSNPASKSHDLEVQIKSARLLSSDNHPTPVIEFNSNFSIEITYEIIRPTRDLCILCRVTDSHGNIVWTSWDTDTTNWKGRVREQGWYTSICNVPGCLLRPGYYQLSVGSYVNNVKKIEYHENVLTFEISEVGYTLNRYRIGVITPLLDWKVEKTEVLEDQRCF